MLFKVLGRYAGHVFLAMVLLPLGFFTAWGNDTNDTAAGGDPVKGKALYAECSGCHQLAENSVGPRHCGVVGREAASVPGFEYSAAMASSGLVWDEQTLNEFLESPFTYVNGTLMGYIGLDDPQDRADLIAYLKSVSDDPAACPP